MIHASTLVDPAARLGENVSIGPFSIVGPEVSIGANTEIGPHVVIEGATRIGEHNRIHQFTSIGCEPQHVGYKGEPTGVVIGDRNTIREYTTISRGTQEGGGVTRIGDDNYLMSYVHIAHDCELGSNIIFANGASLAGHVSVGDYVVLGGFSLVHQFCRVGAHCITGIGTVCLQDVPPYVLAAGNRAATHGINVKGLRRRDFTEQDIRELKRAYKLVYRSGLSVSDALTNLKSREWSSSHVEELAKFLKSSTRGIV